MIFKQKWDSHFESHCTSDGTEICVSCNVGFKLDASTKKCESDPTWVAPANYKSGCEIGLYYESCYIPFNSGQLTQMMPTLAECQQYCEEDPNCTRWIHRLTSSKTCYIQNGESDPDCNYPYQVLNNPDIITGLKGDYCTWAETGGI